MQGLKQELVGNSSPTLKQEAFPAFLGCHSSTTIPFRIAVIATGKSVSDVSILKASLGEIYQVQERVRYTQRGGGKDPWFKGLGGCSAPEA